MDESIPVSFNPRLEIIPTGEAEKVVLVADIRNGKGCIIDYYDTPLQAKRVARHFTRCCTVAAAEGFYLIPGFFTNDTGYGITLAIALDVSESPSKFRETLLELKKGIMPYLYCEFNNDYSI